MLVHSLLLYVHYCCYYHSNCLLCDSLTVVLPQITSASLSADGLNLLVSARFCPTRCIDLRTDKVIIRYLDRNRMAGSTNSFYTSSFCGNDMVSILVFFTVLNSVFSVLCQVMHHYCCNVW